MSVLPDPRPDREPEAVRRQREATERALRRANGSPAPAPAAEPPAETTPQWGKEPEPLPRREPKPPVESAFPLPPTDFSAATEKLGLEFDGVQIEVQVHHICINDYNIAFSFDPARLRFTLKYEKELKLTYRGTSYKIIYAGGLITFPNWPLHILSFMRLEETAKP